MDEQTTKIVLGGVAALAAILGGAFISIRKSKSRNNNSRQENITITGDGNKVIGGDDKSTNNVR